MDERKLKAAATIAALIDVEKDPEIRADLDLAQKLMVKDGIGLLYQLPCAEGSPYYRIERDCSVNCPHYGGGFGESICEVDNHTHAHTWDDTIVPGCPMPFTLEQYTFHLRYFDPQLWSEEFNRMVFLDRELGVKRVADLNGGVGGERKEKANKL